MNKKVKVSAIVAALLAVAPVASSVVTDTTPATVQAAKKSKKAVKYSKVDYENITAVFPKKDIKMSIIDSEGKQHSQTLKKGRMYTNPKYKNGKYYFGLSYYNLDDSVYIKSSNLPFDRHGVYIKSSNFIPFNHSTDKTIKKYMKAFNAYAKKTSKLKENYALAFKFKKKTPIYFNIPDNGIFADAYGAMSQKKKRIIKKNTILAINDGNSDPIMEFDFIKNKGKYYYLIYMQVVGKSDSDSVWVPVDSVKLTKVKNYSLKSKKYNLTK